MTPLAGGQVQLAELLPTGEHCAQLSLTDPVTRAHDTSECVAFTATPMLGGPNPGGRLGAVPSTGAQMAAVGVSALVVVGGALPGAAVVLAARRRRTATRSRPADRYRIAPSVPRRGGAS